jgi:glycosyltransferase involved in cell wall biosynthesis
MFRNKPHLGIYCPGNGTSGPWRYVHSIITGLDPNEFEVTVFCDLPGGYDPRPWVKVVRLGNPVHPAGSPAASPNALRPRNRSRITGLVPKAAKLWAGFGRQTRLLSRLLRQHSIDLFHTQNTGCEESPIAAKLAGLRHVIGTFHVDSTYDLNKVRSGPSHKLLEMISNRCLDAAIAVSHATKRDWVRRSHIPIDRVVTIHLGIDPEKFRRRHTRNAARSALGLPADGLIIGGVGRLDEAKGFAYLLIAASRLRPEFPNLSVAIAGEGSLREKLEADAVRLGIADCVRFLGFQSDVQLVLDSLDVFTLPSLCEALGYALLEAMAAELPVVGSTVGGIPEVIVPGVTGFVVPPENPDQLTASLRKLLQNEKLRTTMGVAGRERVIRHFHERDMLNKTIELYRSFVHATGKLESGPNKNPLIS